MKAPLAFLVALALAVAALYLLDRLLLAFEGRGWIYYRKKQGHADRLGQSALHIQSMLEPGKRYEVVERERVRREEGALGAPPDGAVDREER